MPSSYSATPSWQDLLGIRHRMIANDWRAAELSLLGARHLRRAVAVLERVEYPPAARRADLAGERHAPRYLFSAAELIDRAVDFCAERSILSRDDERSWRVFRERVAALHILTTT